MKPGISSYTYPWAVGLSGYPPPVPLKALDLIRRAHQRSIGFVQYGDNLPLHELPAAELQQLAKKAASLGIGLEAGCKGLRKQHILTYLDIARQLGSPFLRVIIDDEGYHPDEAVIVGEIRGLLPHLRHAGIVLAIENHDRLSSPSLVNIIRETDREWVGICLDTANSLGAGEGVQEVVSHLAPFTVNLHIKDVAIRRVAHKMGFTVEGRPAGEGQLNIPWIIEQVASYRRCRTATLELWPAPEERIEDTIRKEEEWAEQSLRYLQSLNGLQV